jgi:ribonucleoside-diphosphate reductase alpha chain
MTETIFRKLADERKRLQEADRLPPWMITASWQLLKDKYVTPAHPDFRAICNRVAAAAAAHTPDPENWAPKFFELLWKGWLAGSTPVVANMGVSGNSQPVSCSGNTIHDEVWDFYESQKELGCLSQRGYGTSSYLGEIRERGADISDVPGGASGVVPVFRDCVQVAQDISQGSQRRGAWAGYIEINHPDVPELLTYIKNNPEDANIGWIIDEEFIQALQDGDEVANELFKETIALRMMPGKGYYFFRDKVNAANPQMYKDRGLKVKASNLCTEIALFAGLDYTSGEEYTFSCVLSSMNAAYYDEWKGTDAVFVATVFLDCINQEQIARGKKLKGFENIVRFAEDSRALGLGVLGFHTYLQDHSIPFGSLEAHYFNQNIFKELHDESLRASQWMAKEWGEPKWCKGYGVRNTHRIAIAPNLSSSLLAGGHSQGIEPIYKNAYVQSTAAGKVERASPALRKIMKERGIDTRAAAKRIMENSGSVQTEDWLTPHEKQVFLTAFEIPQEDILRLASTRQKYIDQAQSINLFFSADEKEEYISAIHKQAFLDPNIKSLYYVRSEKGVLANVKECIACHA